ncbi:MAG: hypothetical protein JRI34_12215, partial [Deltaproteobacteria bacterium]|nr:hypothetical protein [Deltaproteobacteria bacterium]
MDIENAKFEVEVRFPFQDRDEAEQALPFLSSCLERKMDWTTVFYGQDIFKVGELLRMSTIYLDGKTRRVLTWKGPDIGGFANIRRELTEEMTSGTTQSAILEHLGGKQEIKTPDEVPPELERLGHSSFMSFGGTDLMGTHKALGIRVKLMSCPAIKWPLLLEIEKIAGTSEEAKRFENDLQEICQRFQLENRMVKEEPPTL